MKRINFHNWKNIVIILIVCGLVFFALSGYMTRVIDMLVGPLISVQTAFTDTFQTVYTFVTRPKAIFDLSNENELLKETISEQNIRINELNQALDEAEVLSALLGFARGRPDEDYDLASVIGKDPSPFLKYILIDQGSDDGVRYGMPVATDKGLIGRITAVTASASRVQLLSDSSSLINVYIEGTEIEGVVQGSITGDITIEMVPVDADLQPGQVVMTSGLGGTYPADYVIGQILNLDPSSSSEFKSASVQAAEDFDQLQAVLVVEDFRTSNIEPLENLDTAE